MKIQFIAFVLALCAVLACVAAPPSAPLNPFLYTGRIVDARRTAFDSDRKATITASKTDGSLLTYTETKLIENSRRNYSLQIPMASEEVEGYVKQGSILKFSVTADGKTWEGLVLDLDATVGAPSTVKELDIVLSESTNEYDIDDSLFEELKAMWEDSDYWRYGETFDPDRDYDGDGVSTINEAYAGTDPFNPDDRLKIVDLDIADKTLSFTAIAGHAYSLEQSDAISSGTEWEKANFAVEAGGRPINILSLSGSAESGERKIYLIPVNPDVKSRFFRIKAE